MPVGKESNGEEAAHAARCLARLHLRLDDAVLIADPSAENRAWLGAEYPALPLRLADTATLRAAILSRHGEALKHEAVEGLGRRLPALSARRVLTPAQGVALALLATALLALLLAWPVATLRALVLALSAALLASGLFRALLAWIGAAAPAPSPSLPRHGLPRYTILVPLYREAAVLPGLAAALKALDYPALLAHEPQSQDFRQKCPDSA